MISTYDAQRNERCAYELPEHETPYGATLGNFKTFVSGTPKGGIRGLWDADTDRIVFGTHHLAYRLAGAAATVLPQHVRRTFTFRPYAQISTFDVGGVAVAETFYVPHGEAHARTVAFVVEVTLENRSAVETELSVFAWSSLVGQRFYGETETSVRAEVGARSIGAWNEDTGAGRFWGSTKEPRAVVLAPREATIAGAIRRGSLSGTGSPQASGAVVGAFEYVFRIAPGACETLRIAGAFARRGHAPARAAFDALLDDADALRDTERYYALALADARVLTPSPVVDRAVVWAKTNMLRIVKEYPYGWGSTNSPPSDILVSRDTSWFVHGFDYFLPQFSRDAIEVFDRHLEDSGQVVEYVRGASGFRTSYDLSVNDDTPLHLIALLHHYNVTRDRAWVERHAPSIVRIADYLLAQRDESGLIACTAGGFDMFGITSWRNIIPSYALDGAVTEINAEAAFALAAAATLCAAANDPEHAERYAREAALLGERVMSELYHADTGSFALARDSAGTYRDDVTADVVFPVLFEIAGPAERRALLERLCEPDFTTDVGLRTVSQADAWYFPSHGFGLLGGVWPDLTLWFAVALARNGLADACVERLETIYATMEEGARRNAVPGQFAEWFDGGSLTNRGMYLSPWTGAKYLWAVIETVCGFDGYRTSEELHLTPAVPAGWAWTAAARVRFGGGRCTFVIDAAGQAIYGDLREATAEEPYRYVFAGADVSRECDVAPIEVGVVAFEDEGGGVRAFICNTNDVARDVSLAFRGVPAFRAAVPAGALVEVRVLERGA